MCKHIVDVLKLGSKGKFVVAYTSKQAITASAVQQSNGYNS